MDDFTWHLRHPLETLKEAYFKVKWFWQRGRRGYSDSDAWNLQWYLAGWLPGALRELHGGDGFAYGMTEEIWTRKLVTMIEGFEAIQKQNNLQWAIGQSHGDFMYEWDRLNSKAQAGLREFANHFGKLWD